MAALGWLLLQIPMRELAGALLSAAVLFGPVFLVLTILDLVRPTRTWRLWLSLSFALASVVVAALAFYAIIHH